jgi:hypothetical protein
LEKINETFRFKSFEKKLKNKMLLWHPSKTIGGVALILKDGHKVPNKNSPFCAF